MKSVSLPASFPTPPAAILGFHHQPNMFRPILLLLLILSFAVLVLSQDSTPSPVASPQSSSPPPTPSATPSTTGSAGTTNSADSTDPTNNVDDDDDDDEKEDRGFLARVLPPIFGFIVIIAVLALCFFCWRRQRQHAVFVEAVTQDSAQPREFNQPI